MKSDFSNEDIRREEPKTDIGARMGRKLISVLCILGLSAGLAACGGSEPAAESSVSASAESAEAAETAESTGAAEAIAASAVSESGTSAPKTEIVYAENTESVEESVDPAVSAAAPSPTDAVYTDKIMEIYHMILDYDEENHEAPEGAIGILETFYGKADVEDRLAGVSYAIRDINSDGIDELFILAVESGWEEDTGDTRILSMYTLKDQEAVLAAEGWARNRYYLLEDGSLYREGSNGAAESIFGTYVLDPATASLSVTDYYFSRYADQDSYAVGYYRNQTGSYEIDGSSVVSAEVFAAVMQSFNEEITAFDSVRFSDFHPEESDWTSETETPVINVFADAESIAEYGSFEEFTADVSESSVKLLLVPDSVVNDLRILSLTFSDVSESDIYFTAEELYSQEKLIPERPLALTLTLSETIPNYGLSFRDDSGSTHYYAFAVSGLDGSAHLTKINVSGS